MHRRPSYRGSCTMVLDCERRRCRDGLYVDSLVDEFAARFGSELAKAVDAVACNFPTWQCALFARVNVTVIMRFTHRWDHHLQVRVASRLCAG